MDQKSETRLFTDAEKAAFKTLPQVEQEGFYSRLVAITMRGSTGIEVEKVRKDCKQLIADVKARLQSETVMLNVVEEKTQENVPMMRNPNGPNFVGKLRKHEVEIVFLNGEVMTATLERYNRYEILIEKDDEHFVLMKHGIQSIRPRGEDPFVEEKKEGENHG
jgi:sRNA-binding regulator protein Hfq